MTSRSSLTDELRTDEEVSGRMERVRDIPPTVDEEEALSRLGGEAKLALALPPWRLCSAEIEPPEATFWSEHSDTPTIMLPYTFPFLLRAFWAWILDWY